METSQPLIERIGLIAGEGELPVLVAQNATRKGIAVISYAIGRDNISGLKKWSQRVHRMVPGLLNQNLAMLRAENIHHIVFAGKVNKWLLLRNPRLDNRAVETLKTLIRANDDAIMLKIISMLEAEGLSVLRQTDFLQELFLPAGVLGNHAPTERDQEDIAYGFQLAKEMGRLDIGQTIVVKDGMILAVEAIEGTDECLKRAGKLSRGKGGVVVKVEKPLQDQRFDVPTVGMRTLKTMKKYGLRVLATEAERTLFLDPETMRAYADRHNMTIVSVSEEAIPFMDGSLLDNTEVRPQAQPDAKSSVYNKPTLSQIRYKP